MTIFRLHRPGEPEARSCWASADSEKEARARVFNALRYERQWRDPAAVLGRDYACTAHCEPGASR